LPKKGSRVLPPHKVVVTPRTFAEAGRDFLQVLVAAGIEPVLNPHGRVLTAEELMDPVQNADGLILGLDPATAAVLENAPRLRVISKYGVGTDNIDLETATRMGILVTRAPGSNSSAVAELAFGLMLAVARRIAESDRNIRRGIWGKYAGFELSGKILGIVGTGQIGKQLARLARGFDMQLLCCDIKPDESWARQEGASYVSLNHLLQRADIISLHLPLTADTHHLVAAPQLEAMKPTAILINTARGELVDETALLEALAQNRPAGAGLDVVETDPPHNTPLARLDNVVLTSHIGAHTREAMAAMAHTAVENLVKVFQGVVPDTVVNPEAVAQFRRRWHA
jgi:phosphoglycerate dehydrogenase-like enzyme